MHTLRALVWQRFRETLQSSKHIVVIAGAGLSAASGIPTFRGGGGMWRSLDAMSLATPEAFEENPSLVWQFYHYRRTKAAEARPNAAHEVIAKMSAPAYLKKVAPSAASFHLVTQNVDTLSRVIFPDSVFEMHGRIFDVRCTGACGHVYEDRAEPLCAALGAADAEFASYEDAGTKRIDIADKELPRCPKCGALARPGVVWFGERPYHLPEINGIVFKADMCLVVGTSSTVLPASTFAYRVQRHGGKVAVFNLDPGERDERADFVFRGPCEKVLPDIFPELAA
ncbi:DHS-like NAD/FAD-binding domain-containing protein [Epithele typhae]|uniref:DHS-like NAD/FAD-binding domain-containing protein n=1 Tax=Epithele typhae TaxID=378194 RepID=UPI002008DAFF|nr:DHS-like NAD/FAD-binding domain-containing protein [Epithele typhae]KAH9941708.1 DHS-like NAD/FAD-binding domain-containing protein [Epithele typhae]